MSGVSFVVFFMVAYVIYGQQPQVGATADALVAFYDGNRTPVLITVGLSAWNVLNLLWFAAAFRTTLANAGRDGWCAAVTASSAMLGGAAASAPLIGRCPRALGSRRRKCHSHSGIERLGLGWCRYDRVPARDADHGRNLRALAR